MKFNLSVVNGQALVVRRTVVGVGESLALPHGSTLLYSELVDDRGTDALEVWYAEPTQASSDTETLDTIDVGTARRIQDLPPAGQIELPDEGDDEDDDYYY